jgi:hypothetical protein
MGDDFEVIPNDYTVKQVSIKLGKFLERKLDRPNNGQHEGENFRLGLIVAGYDPNDEETKEYVLGFHYKRQDDGQDSIEVEEPTLIPYEGKSGPNVGSGIFIRGQLDVVQRITRGYGSLLNGQFDNLDTIQDPDSRADWEHVRKSLFSELVHPGMPIQDAIDLSVFLHDSTAQYLRFIAGPQSVGGAVEIATITKYEGFRWVTRKEYDRL